MGGAVVLDLTFFLIAVPAVLFAGISKGGFASGAAFAATPLLALILEPEQAVALMLPLLMVMDVGAMKAFWRKWSRHEARLLMLASLPGLALGAVFFRAADPDLFRLLIGVVAVAFVAFQLARQTGLLRPLRRPMGPVGGTIAGVAMGFTSFVSHAGGPPASVYMLSRPLDKTTFQATSVIVFWLVNLLKVPPYAALGLFSSQMFVAIVILAPVALAGVWLGYRLHNKVPEKLFFGLTYVFLLATGAKLIFDALS
ncbi:sulfite exporter TauE/SafE family protein [Aliiroseovarius sp. PTFE2010]|uniref:sulfite exporter TauE/SafE family protein n=1 Tax=Aliiroseovarius sp. PTFE2010 TaxID=3417190 RepID=UPI003CF3919F